jgi:signal transduction histidine kinase
MLMSLRARLLLLILGMVAVTVLALSALQLNSLVATSLLHTIERANSAAQIVKNFILQRAREKTKNSPAPATRADVVKLWRDSLAADPELAAMLTATMAQTRSLVEISVSGEHGRIVASSTQAKIGTPMSTRLPLQALSEIGPIERLEAIFGGSRDYETRVDLGIPGEREPVFTIQVLVSSVLLRETIRLELIKTILVSLAALIVATLLAWLVTHIALSPLTGLSQEIDRITSGQQEPTIRRPAAPGREYAVVEEKLRLLGEQYRGAQMGATQLRGNVEQMLERLEEAILLFDERGKLLMCGEPAERILGHPRSEITGRSLHEVFPPATELGATLVQAAETHSKLRDTTAGGVLVDLDFLPGGGMLLRLRDAVGRQIVENQLSLSSRLAAISRLTGGVAHEIKNPLNSIALRLELLRSRVLPNLPEAKPEIEIIAQEITRLDRVVRTFLDFTRPVELNAKPLNLTAMVRELITFLGPESHSTNIEVKEDLPAEPLWVRGDADLVRQAIMNVLRNALDAMPHGGTLNLRLRRERGEAVLSISDTGAGIPPENRDKIFQLYYSTKERGTGIGLAMTYRAFQLHGGSIEVESDGGATFHLRLPLISGSEAA